MKQLKLTAIFATILTTILFFILWLIDYSNTGIPEKVPGIEYQTYGIAMFISVVAILYIYQKLTLKHNPSASIMQLTGWSFLVALLSQFVYQLVRQIWILRFENNNIALEWSISMIALSFLMLLIALSIALELKKARPIFKTLSVMMFVGIILLLKEYFGNITW